MAAVFISARAESGWYAWRDCRCTTGQKGMHLSRRTRWSVWCNAGTLIRPRWRGPLDVRRGLCAAMNANTKSMGWRGWDDREDDLLDNARRRALGFERRRSRFAAPAL